MKKFTFCFALIALLCQIGLSQEGNGGGSIMNTQTEQCLSDDDRVSIKERIQQNILALKAEGKLNSINHAAIVEFKNPVKQDAELDYYNAFTISNYLDQDGSSQIQDYKCGDRSYDGHRGIDIATWPFSWYLYENDMIDVVAAADGVIVLKDDGQDDDHCECFGSWNAVYIMHADGSVAWYGHLKKFSLLNKPVGASVSEGDFLGKMASSGCSTGPHLHLEVYDANEKLIDPNKGDCNSLNSQSWWFDQDEYWMPQVNALFTHSAPPEFGCPTNGEVTNFSNDFLPGDLIYFVSYFRDHLEGDVTYWSIIDPNGSIWDNWLHIEPMTYSSSFWYWNFYLPNTGPFGEWTFQVVYNEKEYIHKFNYGIVSSVDDEEIDDLHVYPNPAGDHVIIDVKNIRSVVVYNLNGQVVTKSYENSKLVDLSQLSDGVYFFNIDTEEKSYFKKILVKK